MVKTARRKLKRRLQEQAPVAMTSHRQNKPPAPALFSASVCPLEARIESPALQVAEASATEG
eukprot:CAMPEP_0172866378 /NCGR_PEP_ID=MMETSP1075-20121228/81951_1 /TAXON_ID=2916 /ORGANISM="Ceratium fusus, Strain PA161109" /LENGTH=61 /DNA_ID=CAMNT_0013715539 /DNA_START=101 /DNA_END=283 /DNA_ORIENTATION=+